MTIKTIKGKILEIEEAPDICGQEACILTVSTEDYGIICGTCLEEDLSLDHLLSHADPDNNTDCFVDVFVSSCGVFVVGTTLVNPDINNNKGN